MQALRKEKNTTPQPSHAGSPLPHDAATRGMLGDPVMGTQRTSVSTLRQVRTYLLCAECEERFNSAGTNYAMTQVDNGEGFPLRKRLNVGASKLRWSDHRQVRRPSSQCRARTVPGLVAAGRPEQRGMWTRQDPPNREAIPDSVETCPSWALLGQGNCPSFEFLDATP